MSSRFDIDGRPVGGGERCFLIAEVAQAHDGSLGQAHAFIDAAAAAGADAIKFQTHIASAESTLDEAFRVPMRTQDATRFAYWRRMEFDADAWRALAGHAHDAGLVFLSSAFSAEAVDLLDELGVPAWKVGSGEFRSKALLERMAATGKPLMLSTGMSRWSEIDEMVSSVRLTGCPFAVFQCTSMYPTPLQHAGLNVIAELRERYGCVVGLSDHTASPWTGIAAIARGLDLLEVHVTFDRRMFGPDTSSSLTFDEFAMLREARDAIATLDASPVDKDFMAGQLREMRALFTKSLALREDAAAGTLVTADMLCGKKPGSGIPAADAPSYVGRRLRTDVRADRLLRPDDFEPLAGARA